MNDFQPLLDLLAGKAGWLPTLITWLAALKLAMVCFENQFARWSADQLNRIAAEADEGDDAYLRRIFADPSYRLIGFLLRLVGFRLPTLADLERAIRLQREAAIEAGANLRAPRRTGPTRSILSAFAVSLTLLVAGCGTLDKTGVYRGDALLHQAELAITTSYDLIHTYVRWEKENRAALAHWPQMRKSADAMRAGAPQWFKTAHALRDAYQLDPSEPNRAALAQILNVLRAALAEAAGYMGTASAMPRPPTLQWPNNN